ncbi:AAA family ATPase [Halomonas sp.]|uniref:AAA family ATPase n=1 Tax=Halomonas sp. TaxID=1486246 RepID=UPI0035619AE8
MLEELAEGTVTTDKVGDADCIFLTGLYQAERAIAEHLGRIRKGPLPWPEIDADKALPWIEQKTGLTLAASQAKAVRLALTSKVMVITGGPGVGKTTIVNSILRILAAKSVKLLLCAPTGRAAKRMTEAKTIHRLLEFDPKAFGFKRNDENPLNCDLLVIDESSMVDVLLMQSLMKAVPTAAALLIVGDIEQLPSVGPSQVLADVIGSGAVPMARLTEVFRQAAQSKIITTAHAINAGHIPDLTPPEGETDFYFVPAADPEQAVPRIVELVAKRIPRRFGFDPIKDIQVLCPMNRGGVGARSLNIGLQAALNPAGDKKVERFGWTFAPGDKVMQIENDYDKDWSCRGLVPVVNDAEAASVRQIFQRFVELGSANVLARELRRDEFRNKQGTLIDKGYLYRLLNNRVYRGEPFHKGTAYPGEHDAIIDQDLWDRVHAILRESPRKRANNSRSRTPALLKGLIFSDTGAAMTPTSTKKGAKLYRYYVSMDVIRNRETGEETAPMRLAAGMVEDAVVTEVRRILQTPEVVTQVLAALKKEQDAASEADAIAALHEFSAPW